MRRIVADMRLLLSDSPSEDRAVARLFPDAYESNEDARAFRELVGEELRSGKLRALEAMEQSLGEKGAVDETLSAEQANAWLTSLTDMRLTLGTRLDVTEETMAADVDPEDPNAALLAVLHWLGWLQESLLRALGTE
ncbi:MAG: DUF2017 domain-containing protein [Actinomycetota bacterium]|nr:DUF2017 domain-containing protein [Actinomycetota bacterium]